MTHKLRRKKVQSYKKSNSVIILIIILKKLSENKISFVEKIGLAESLRVLSQSPWLIYFG